MMTTLEAQKLHLIEWITQISDKQLIDYLLEIAKYQQDGNWVADLSEADRASILKGMEEAENGKTRAAAEVFNRFSRSNL